MAFTYVDILPKQTAGPSATIHDLGVMAERRRSAACVSRSLDSTSLQPFAIGHNPPHIRMLPKHIHKGILVTDKPEGTSLH